MKQEETGPAAGGVWDKLNRQMSLRALLCGISQKTVNWLVFPLLGVLALMPPLVALGLKWLYLMWLGYYAVFFGVLLLVWDGVQPRARTGGRRDWLRDHGLKLFLGLMLLWSVLSTLTSTNRELSFYGDDYRQDGLLAYFYYAGYFLLACHLRDRRLGRWLLALFAFGGAALALLTRLDFGWLNGGMGVTLDCAVFKNCNHYGYYLTMALTAAVYLAMSEEKRGRWLGFAVRLAADALALVLLSDALIQCHTLGALVGVGFALAVLAAFTLCIQRKKALRLLCVLLLVGATLAVSSRGSWDMGREAKRLTKDLQTVGEAVADKGQSITNTYSVGSGRGILWVNAVRFIGERPLVGYGPDNLGQRYTEVGARNDRPHNELLQFAASLGLPAALCYVAAMLCHLLRFLKNLKKVDMALLSLFTVLLAYLTSSMFGNTMYYTSPFFFLLLGLSDAMLGLRLTDEG